MRNCLTYLVIIGAVALKASGTVAQAPTSSPLFRAPQAASDTRVALLPDQMRLEAPRARTIEDCQVIARVNGHVVLACEILWMVNLETEARLSKIPEPQRSEIPPEELEKLRDALMRMQLGRLLETKLVYTDFLRKAPPQLDLKKIHASLEEPFEEREIPRLKEIFEVETVAEVESRLVAVGSSLRERRASFNETMIAQSWLQENVKIDKTVRPDELLDYYRAHRSDYEFPTEARWEELMIRFASHPDNQSAYRAMAELGNEALAIASRANRPGEPLFAELAKAKSEGYTASSGGEHPWTTQGALKAEAIDQAIFSMPVGDLSPILETELGFHIVRVIERREAGCKPFEDVQSEIRDKILDERSTAAIKKKLGEVRAAGRIWTIYTGETTLEGYTQSLMLGR